jgi:cytochrome c-type biogenesis protein CcmH/NrfG
VFKRIYPSIVAAAVATLGWTMAVRSQGLVPYTPKQSSQYLEQTGKQLLDSAKNLIAFQQYEQAISRISLSTQLAPKNHQAWYFLGTLYVQTQKYDRAVEALKTGLALKPQDADTMFMLGSAYFQKGDRQQAIDILQAGLKLKPDHTNALFDLGNAYYTGKQYNQAVAQYQKAVAKDPKFWPAINNIGLVKYESGDIEGAIQAWDRSIALEDPKAKAAEPRLAKAVALYVRGKSAEAYELLSAAMKIDTRYASVPYLKENLWGDKLLNDARRLIQSPKGRDAITKYPGNTP